MLHILTRLLWTDTSRRSAPILFVTAKSHFVPGPAQKNAFLSFVCLHDADVGDDDLRFESE